jgi:hypothetical protein
MVLEVAVLDVIAATRESFEEAFRTASPLIASGAKAPLAE